MKNREKLLQDFLSKSDWDQANRQSIASDASGRTYERLTLSLFAGRGCSTNLTPSLTNSGARNE